MKRVHRTKEIDQLQKIKKENDALKREVKQLRKQLDRASSQRYFSLEDMAEKQKKEAEEDAKAKKEAALQEKRRCWVCGKGTLKLIPFPRRDGIFYYRSCTTETCGHKTKLKPYIVGVTED